MEKQQKCKTTIVGCGEPNRGMGWYHAMNIIEGCIPSCSLSRIVEPFFLEAGKDLPAGKRFGEWAQGVKRRKGEDGSYVSEDIDFLGNLDDLGDVEEGEVRMGVVSGRTNDNEKFCRRLLEKGYKYILLEKPGATTPKELKELLSFAKEQNATIIMGYIKNISNYISLGREFEKQCRSDHPSDSLSLTLLHSNDYTEQGLPECFERNAEGALKNMAIHELALLSTFWGVKVGEGAAKAVKSVSCDVDYCDFRNLNGFEDFVKGGLVIEIGNNTTIRLLFDRCGGAFSEFQVAVKCPEGKETKKEGAWRCPGPEETSFFEEKQRENPEIMSYFLLQHSGYVFLKKELAELALGEKKEMDERVAGLEIGVNALDLAEEFQSILLEACKA